nr:MAG TPA: hypothetical protein [Caudoviricetes sp.]
MLTLQFPNLSNFFIYKSNGPQYFIEGCSF